MVEILRIVYFLWSQFLFIFFRVDKILSNFCLVFFSFLIFLVLSFVLAVFISDIVKIYLFIVPFI